MEKMSSKVQFSMQSSERVTMEWMSRNVSNIFGDCGEADSRKVGLEVSLAFK